MILLSPAVTAFTQLFLSVTKSRSTFLRTGLTSLIRQLDGAPVQRLRVVPDARIVASRNGNILTVSVDDPAVHHVYLDLIPRGAQNGESFESGATNEQGVATIVYRHAGSLAYTGNTATVSVLNLTGAAVAGAAVTGAAVTCVIQTGPIAGTNVTLAGNQFTYPENSRPAPAQYRIECTVRDAAGAALRDRSVRFDFARNDTFDEHLEAVTGANGQASFTLPSPGMNTEVAQTIAEAVLMHPMIGRADLSPGFLNWLSKKAPTWIRRDASGEVIQREELTRILLELAAGEGAGELKDESVREALVKCLKQNGIPDPAATLADIRAEAQRLEKEHPRTACHIRASEAIITAGQSDYVGRINAWFDQTMERTTQRYSVRARAVTIAAAFVVAFAIQMDSLDLLRRLSVDDKLRNSLLEEARVQQNRIDRLERPDTPQAEKDELETVKAARDEIQQNLTGLRLPQLAILPDHFIWQEVPQASLVRNPMWKAPYPSRFELIVGSASYIVSPRWRRDMLQDLKDAIDDLRAPVSARIAPGEEVFLLTAKKAGQLELSPEDGQARLTPVVDLGRACLRFNPDWPDPVNAGLHLLLDGQEQGPAIPLIAVRRENVLSAVGSALQARAAIAVRSSANELCITALESRVSSIQLLYDRVDPFSNILSTPERITRVGTVP